MAAEKTWAGIGRQQHKLLPEAQQKCRLPQFLRNLFLEFVMWYVQRDRQRYGVPVVDLQHHGVLLCCLSSPSMLGTESMEILKDPDGSCLFLDLNFPRDLSAL